MNWSKKVTFEDIKKWISNIHLTHRWNYTNKWFETESDSSILKRTLPSQMCINFRTCKCGKRQYSPRGLGLNKWQDDTQNLYNQKKIKLTNAVN